MKEPVKDDAARVTDLHSGGVVTVRDQVTNGSPDFEPYLRAGVRYGRNECGYGIGKACGFTDKSGVL